MGGYRENKDRENDIHTVHAYTDKALAGSCFVKGARQLPLPMLYRAIT